MKDRDLVISVDIYYDVTYSSIMLISWQNLLVQLSASFMKVCFSHSWERCFELPPSVIIAFLEKVVNLEDIFLKHDYQEDILNISFVPASILVTLHLWLYWYLLKET